MMKYLKLFTNHSDYEAFVSGGTMVRPNVSHCVNENEVHYNPIETRLIVRYNVTNASYPTQLYAYEEDTEIVGVNMFDKVEIDGTEVSIADLDAASGQTQLSVGEHTIKYTLKDPTSIVDYVFSDCNSLISVTIPNSVSSIGSSAFSGCTGLTSLTIGNSVTSIGYNAFYKCTSLTSVTIPNSVTSIRDDAFEDCSSLTSVTIGNSVTSIGDYAFEDCSSLTSIKVESGNPTYDSRNDCNAIIETASNTLVTGCKNTVIPNSVTSIGVGAFKDCFGLTSVTIPNSVTSIGGSAFQDCSGLTSVTIPNSVTSIGGSAFQDCSGLTSVTIPNSVTSIGDYAFYGCTGLTSVVSLGTTAPTIQNNTFQNVKTNGTLTVPSGSSGYDVWMGTGNYYLGKYGWTKVEQ